MNHLELLKKYMRHVRDCEGIDFTGSLGDEEEFTQEEVELLQAISKEINRV